ncbi:precursor of CEP6-like [Vigna radiata var. radiata]|uniref:Precursor of CEP6-like n=1 Tax=Vigna radiata var. radiata TaxID=3916 RepID=A0A3Q0F7U2_VIGRR|nr:precursor of CEP6-like [Vigna radiata var. radiata]
MATFHAKPRCVVIFLALVAFNGSLVAHCRQIKPLNKHSSKKKDTEELEFKASATIPTTSSLVISKHDVEGFGDTNAFRPTTPGSSPGVGHRKFAAEDKDVKATVAVQSPDVKFHFTEGTESGFKPTNPGHSPGVGHAQQNQIGQ